MPQHFEFTRTDPYVQQHLTPHEINAVTTWQSPRLDYQFSFHTMHEAGWPCYLVEPTGPERNLPKINLKVPTTPLQMLQQDSVRSQHVSDDFYAVIGANLAFFQRLADRFYEGVEVVVNRNPSPVVTFKCNKSATAKPILVKLPTRAQVVGTVFWSNFKAFAKPPKCSLHRTADCMVGTAEMMQYADAIKVQSRFDDYGEVKAEI